MMEKLSEERRQFLDLVILIAAVSIVTAWLASVIRTLSPILQGLTVFIVLGIAAVYLYTTPLFSLKETKEFGVPLFYDAEEETFLVPAAYSQVFYEDIANPVNRVWHRWRGSSSDREGDDMSLFDGDDLSPLYELIEFGLVAVLSGRYHGGWLVEGSDWMQPIGSSWRYQNDDSRTISLEDLRSAFGENRFLEVLAKATEEEQGPTVLGPSLLGEGAVFHLPPGTDIVDRSESEQEPPISIDVENPYVDVRIRGGTYVSNPGLIPWRRTDSDISFGGICETEPVDPATSEELMERYQNCVVRVRATIEPEGLRGMLSKAPDHWKWAEDLVACLEDAADYAHEEIVIMEYGDPPQ